MAKAKRRVFILVLEAMGFVIAGSAFGSGVGYALSNHNPIATIIGASLGFGAGLLCAMEGEA
jgi:hypothetical protein